MQQRGAKGQARPEMRKWMVRCDVALQSREQFPCEGFLSGEAFPEHQRGEGGPSDGRGGGRDGEDDSN